MTAPRRGPASRAADALASPVLNNLIGLVGIVTPIVAWLSARGTAKNVLLVAETVIVMVLVGSHIWLRQRFITLRRANNLRSMDDAHYYDLVRAKLENELIADYNAVADGHVQVYAGEVPRLSVMLVNTLVESGSQPQRILAADLTTNPALLTGRRDYLAANRQFLQNGGTINRLFIAFESDLLREDYARDLLNVITHHRDLGVSCGLAVRDRLRADQAVDVVILSRAAALVEEEQGDADYTKGRSTMHFKGVDRWISRFESIWGNGTDSAPTTLRTYETAVRPLLETTWDEDRVRHVVDKL
ncbi:hypothetical protein BLA24_30885 [Streptomyces cinnamoneus]|uniref:Uncharacterized protein n=1 Tax=Streptomyces cinnamoneus TaxID=53446 RepID=A0A2G1X9K5_STRCJ|nr:hypothetical protein [Streptomyces cinnamoneus]PHQ47910.1 hypothetical protein BLA24_30885 [Streptomyces cinnamoneus]PPT15535.1 hypothetical protein CYQ11_23985 [Streptomyces cinnamoneus]